MARRCPARKDPTAVVLASFPRNVTGMLLFELTWGFGMPFALYVSLVPAYLTALGASKSLIGFVQSLWTIFTPLQLIGGHYFSGRGRLRKVMSFYMLATGARLAYDVIAVFVPGIWTPASLAGFFILACATYIGLIVIGQSLYFGVLTDNVPPMKRGWVFGLRSLCLGGGGMLTGLASAQVLLHWPSPFNYRVSFLIGDFIWTAAALSLFLIRDTPLHRSPRRRPGFLRSLLTKTRFLLGNPNYRIFLFFWMLNSVALTIAAFLVAYAKEDLAIPDSSVALLSTIYLAANAFLGFFVGRLADRVGYRSVGAAQSILLLAVFILAVAARRFPAICVAYALYSLVNNTNSFVLVNMSVELCPSLNGTDLLAIGGTMVLPFVAVASPLAGSIIDQTGMYAPVFFIGATIAVISLFGFSLLVREPRTGRLYEFKQITMR